MLTPEQFVVESSLHMLSPSGRCRMWDAGADGYARGEGAAAVFLKPLSRALADGDHVRGIIRETGVNSDGRTRGVTVPSPAAQAGLIFDLRPGRAGPQTSRETGASILRPTEELSLLFGRGSADDVFGAGHDDQLARRLGRLQGLEGLGGLGDGEDGEGRGRLGRAVSDGTGTQAGDPREAAAIHEAFFGRDSDDIWETKSGRL